MSYSTVITANADTALKARVTLALQDKAYKRIDNVADGDQREYASCKRMFSDSFPLVWITMTLLVLDSNGTLATATDAEINTAVTAAWNRIQLVG